MVDADTVRRLLASLADFRRRLSELREMPIERYEREQAFAGRYLVQASAQGCIDLCNHVISSEGWRVPEDFRDGVTVLEEHGALDHPLAERLRDLVGLRNRLVHLYQHVDDALVYEALKEGVDDLDAFATTIARLVEQGA